MSETSASWLSSSALLQWKRFSLRRLNLQPPLLVTTLKKPGSDGNHQHRSQKTPLQVLPL